MTPKSGPHTEAGWADPKIKMHRFITGRIARESAKGWAVVADSMPVARIFLAVYGAFLLASRPGSFLQIWATFGRGGFQWREAKAAARTWRRLIGISWDGHSAKEFMRWTKRSIESSRDLWAYGPA